MYPPHAQQFHLPRNECKPGGTVVGTDAERGATPRCEAYAFRSEFGLYETCVQNDKHVKRKGHFDYIQM